MEEKMRERGLTEVNERGIRWSEDGKGGRWEWVFGGAWENGIRDEFESEWHGNVAGVWECFGGV